MGRLTGMASKVQHVLISAPGMLGAYTAKVFRERGWNVTLVDRGSEHDCLREILGDDQRLSTTQMDVGGKAARERALSGSQADFAVDTAVRSIDCCYLLTPAESSELSPPARQDSECTSSRIQTLAEPSGSRKGGHL